MSRTQGQLPRSWTELEQPAKRRPAVIAGLFLLLIGAVVAYLVWMIPKVEQRVFAFGYSVDQIPEEQFPWPAFASWDLSQSQSEAWSPWLMSDNQGQSITVADQPKGFCEKIRTLSDLSGIPDSVLRRFRESGASPKDTLVIYLRSHSLEIFGNKESGESQFILLAPEADATEKVLKGKALEEILDRLSQIKVGNIVVLADIADLNSIPKIGKWENNITSPIARLMQRVGSKGDGKRGTPIWLILPRGDNQPSHVSFILGKTLLQSAAEYALGNLNAGESQKHLSLTKFYEEVLRYSHKVTGGYQMPLLFRSGFGSAITDTNSTTWKEAELVNVALRAKKNILPDKVPKDKVLPPGGKTGHAGSNPTDSAILFQPDQPLTRAYLVSANSTQPQQDDPQSSRGSATTSAPNASAASSQGSNAEVPNSGQVPNASNSPGYAGSAPSTSGPAAEPDKEPWLRFWQLRDSLSRSLVLGSNVAGSNARGNNGHGWSPADFAVGRWQELQRVALKLERLWYLSEDGSELRGRVLDEVKALIEELELAARAFTANSRGNPAGLSISDAWGRFRSSVDNPKDPRRPWLDPQLLASDLQPQWAEQREKLRQFIDVCSEAPAWIELYAEPVILAIDVGTQRETNEIIRLRPQIGRLIDNIIEFKAQIAGRETLLDQSIDYRSLDTILSQRAQLMAELETLVNKNRQLLDSKDKKLTWRDERTLQILLSSPLITRDQRVNLRSYFTSSKSLESRLSRPGNENENTSDVALSELLRFISVDSVDPRLWTHKLPALVDGEHSIAKWLKACFAVVLSASDSSENVDQAGFILPVSKDTGLSIVKLDSKHQIPNPLKIVLRHRNGTSMDYCWLDWKQLSSGDNNRYQLTANLAGSEVRLPTGLAHRIDMSRDEFSLVFRPTTSETVPIEGVAVEVRLAREESELLRSEPRSVRILPENPNRVDLFVKRWDRTNNRLDDRVYGTIQSQNNTILRGVIEVPAVGHQAQSQYQLYLCNRYDKDRKIRARLYSASSPLDSGNGEITPEAINRSIQEVRTLKLITSVGLLELSGSPLTSLTNRPDELPNNARPLVFPAIDTGPKSVDNYGLVLVIDDAPPEGTDTPGLLGKPQYIWLDSLSQTPCPLGNNKDDWLVKITPRRDDGLDVDFDISVSDETWSRWGLEKLDIGIELTNENNQWLRNRNPSGVELSPAANEATLRVRPDLDSLPKQPNGIAQQPEKVLVHFSIGSYPRATAYEYRNSGSITTCPDGFLWLEPIANTDPESDSAEGNSIIELWEGEKQLPVSRLRSDSRTFVLPNRIDANDKSRGTATKADRLVVPYRLDFPRDGHNHAAKVVMGSLTPEILRHDRRFETRVDVVDGRLAFTSAAHDHQYVVRDVSRKTMLQNQQPLTISVEETNLRDEVAFIFDTQEPRESLVELPKGSNLYEGEAGAIRVALSVTDAESDIREVYFAINREKSNELVRKYDDQDEAIIKATLTEGKDKWTATFKHDSLANAGILRGLGSEYHVVARSIDLAGNIQDGHKSRSFFWKGKKTSTSKPAKK